MAAKVSTGRVEVVRETFIGVHEASGIAPLGDDVFLVVDDERGVFRCGLDGSEGVRVGGASLSDLEGICTSPDGRQAFLLAERDGSVWRFPIDGEALGEGKSLGRLPRLSSRRNRGWEGIAIAPAGTVSEPARLVAVHQTGPRRIGIFDLETLSPQALLRLPKDARKLLGDLNDVAVAPSGHLFVLSGKTGILAELELDGVQLELVRTYKVANKKNDVPEGITFDRKGHLWLVTDGEGHARQLELVADG